MQDEKCILGEIRAACESDTLSKMANEAVIHIANQQEKPDTE